MYFYKIFDLCVKSDFKMDLALPCVEGKHVDATIQYEPKESFTVELTEEQKKNPYCCFCNHQENRSELHFPFQGDFVVENGNKITYSLKENAERDYVEQVFLFYCMTILQVQYGRIILHGSALDWKDKAIIISGNSGAGKSTLTNYLVKKGHKFLSDDVVPVDLKEEILAVSSFPIRKLCTDAVKREEIEPEILKKVPDPDREKYTVWCKEQFIQGKRPLSAMIVLNVTDEPKVSIREINGVEKIKYITEQLFRRDVYLFTGMQKKQFLDCVKLANRIQVFVLNRPMGKMTVDEQTRQLEELVG